MAFFNKPKSDSNSSNRNAYGANFSNNSSKGNGRPYPTTSTTTTTTTIGTSDTTTTTTQRLISTTTTTTTIAGPDSTLQLNLYSLTNGFIPYSVVISPGTGDPTLSYSELNVSPPYRTLIPQGGLIGNIVPYYSSTGTSSVLVESLNIDPSFRIFISINGLEYYIPAGPLLTYEVGPPITGSLLVDVYDDISLRPVGTITTSTTTTTTTLPAHVVNQFTVANYSDKDINVIYLGGSSGNPDSDFVIHPNGNYSIILTTSDESIDYQSSFDQTYTITIGNLTLPEEVPPGSSFIGPPLTEDLIAQLYSLYTSDIMYVGNDVTTTTTSTTTTTTTIGIVNDTIFNNTTIQLSYYYLINNPSGLNPIPDGVINAGDTLTTNYTTINSMNQGVWIYSPSSSINVDIYLNGNITFTDDALSSNTGFGPNSGQGGWIVVNTGISPNANTTNFLYNQTSETLQLVLQDRQNGFANISYQDVLSGATGTSIRYDSNLQAVEIFNKQGNGAIVVDLYYSTDNGASYNLFEGNYSVADGIQIAGIPNALITNAGVAPISNTGITTTTSTTTTTTTISTLNTVFVSYVGA